MNNTGTSPCMGCKERHLKCHAECEKYNAFKKGIEDDKQKAAEYKEKYYRFPKIISGKTTAEYKAARQKEGKKR